MIINNGRFANHSPPPSQPEPAACVRTLYNKLRNDYGPGSGNKKAFFIGVNESNSLTPYYSAATQRLNELVGKSPLMIATWPCRHSDPGYTEWIDRCKLHYKAGGMISIAIEPDNYLTGGVRHDRDRDSYASVSALLSPSGSNLGDYRAYLDTIASTLTNDMVVDGKPIPMMVRMCVEANGWKDYPDRTVTSLTRSGTTATMQLTASSGTVDGFGVGRKFQIRGASDSGWNKCWTVLSSSGGGTPAATVTFSVPNTLAVAPGGTITSYSASGYFWAGQDRSAATLEMFRQTVTYLRDIKGLKHLLFGPDLFFYNRIYTSTDNTSYPYSNWLIGMDSYYDFVSLNFYQDADPDTWPYIDYGHSDVVSSFNVFADWAEARGRPIFLHEHGALIAGASSDDFWSTKCFTPIDSKYRRLSGACFFRQPWLPDQGSPAAKDLLGAMSNQRYRFL